MNAGCSPPRQGRTCTTRRKVHFPITDSRARRQLLRLIARGMKIRDAEVRLEARANGDAIQAAAGEREVPEVAGVPEARGGIGTCSIDVVGDHTTLNGIASPARIGPSCVRILEGDGSGAFEPDGIVGDARTQSRGDFAASPIMSAARGEEMLEAGGSTSSSSNGDEKAAAICSIPWTAVSDGEMKTLYFGNLPQANAAPAAAADVAALQNEQEVTDVMTASDLGSGYAATLTASGQWMQYTVDVKLGGTYRIDFRAPTSAQATGTFELHVDGVNVTGPITVADPTEWSQWRTVATTGVNFPSGTHVVRLYLDARASAGAVDNFNYFRFVRVNLTAAPTARPPTPADFTATPISASQVDLTWNDTHEKAAGFKIERALRGETYATIATLCAGTSGYSDTGLAPKTEYFYRIRAINAAGDRSLPSKQTPTTTLPLPESEPESEAGADAEEHAEAGADADAGPVAQAEPKPSLLPDQPQSAEPTQSAEPPPSPAPIENTTRQATDGASSHEAPSPQEWLTSTVGPSAVAGSAFYADATFTVSGAGSDIWGRSDAFCFVYRRLAGDGQIVARLARLPRADLALKAGVMMRETLDGGSRHVGLFATPAAGVRFLRRREPAGATTNAVTTDNRAARPPCWLKLERRGGMITAFRSADGGAWQLVGSESIALSDPVYVGLAVASRTEGMSNLSIFDNVSVDGG